MPGEGISIYFDPRSTRLRSVPTWRLEIQREATEADLEGNHALEMVGEIIWTTMLEITHCPYCGNRLIEPEFQLPGDFGRFVHIDNSGWNSRRR